MKRRNMYWMIGAVAFLFSGCNLLPEEEELRSAPVVSSYEAEEYRYVAVERGDLIRKDTLACIYEPTTEEVLSFTVSGERYDNIYVQIGDTVKAGDLLADLEMEDVVAVIDDSLLTLTKLELQLDYIYKMTELEKEKLAIIGGELKDSPGIKNYEAQKSQVEDAIYIAKKRLAENQELMKQRQIYAGMDGVVSEIKAFKKNDKSLEGEKFITVTDPSLSFAAKTEYVDYFTLGMEAELTVGEDSYSTSVIAIDKLDTGLYEIKFGLNEPTTNLSQGARGTYTLILEEAKDVLSVSSGAIVESGEGFIVYAFDEDGFKTIKSVELGLYADGKYEVTGGLVEGELVIVD